MKNNKTETLHRIPVTLNFFPVDIRFEINDKWYDVLCKSDESVKRKAYTSLVTPGLVSKDHRHFSLLRDLLTDTMKVIDSYKESLNDPVRTLKPNTVLVERDKDSIKLNITSSHLWVLERSWIAYNKMHADTDFDQDKSFDVDGLKCHLCPILNFVGLDYNGVLKLQRKALSKLSNLATSSSFIFDEAFLADDYSYYSVRVLIKTDQSISNTVKSIRGSFDYSLNLESKAKTLFPFKRSFSFKTYEHTFVHSEADVESDTEAFDYTDSDNFIQMKPIKDVFIS